MGATILVVEDDLTILDGVSIGLERAGYTVVTATNGAQGLERLYEVTPDLVLADIMMPVMDGYEFYKAFRANPDWELVPFIYITAKGRPQEIRAGKLLGVDDYLPKPFEIEDVLAAVKARLKRTRDIVDASQREVQTLKNRVLRLLHHELRTPLMQIKGYADLVDMEGEQLDYDSLGFFLEGLGKGSRRLTNLIEDLLLVVDIEGGGAEQHFKLKKERVDALGDLIADVAATFEEQTASREITLHLDLSPDLPPVEASVEYLSDALARLIDNAIKYSTAGEKVEVRAEAQSDTAMIVVADEGRGIPYKDLPYIFDVFYQVNRERFEQQGAGLGLPIVKGLVEAHGGRIEVESEENFGTTFRVFLPAANV